MRQETDTHTCAGCRRKYHDDSAGYHAARHWASWPCGLVCRTCQRRDRRGELDLSLRQGARA